MESTEEQQQSEITVLKSIYDGDFIECPPPKAWKGASRLPEFIIKVSRPDAPQISFHLHTKFPKTYPNLSCPIFTIQEPTQKISQEQIAKLSNAIHAEAQRSKGSVMVFEIITFAQTWLEENVALATEAPGSLAMQMSQRAMDEERAKEEREALERQQEYERQNRAALQLQEQVLADTQRQQNAKTQLYKARKRAESDATAVPSAGDTPTETFNEELEVAGVRFRSVKIFHPREECLGTTYLADPVCDDVHATLPLELFMVTFESPYYSGSGGRAKLQDLEVELQKLTSVRHENLLRTFAVKLSTPNSSSPPRLVILSEQRPSLSLQDVLQDCESLREDRACDYIAQILSALNAIHAAGIIHRGVYPRCIGLAPRGLNTNSKLVKLGKAGYYVRLLDMHKSNPLGTRVSQSVDETLIPDSWRSKDMIDDPLTYNRNRDIHYVGIVFLQMLLGQDVMERFEDFHLALQSASITSTSQQCAMNMLQPKKNVSCLSLLADFRQPASYSTSRVPTTPIPSHGGSPELGYFAGAARTRQSSRWKEDWEALEELGKGGFGQVVKARNNLDNRIYAVKKIKLRQRQSDTKIFREVNALSRLNHPYIVRYYTTWVETSETVSSTASSETSDSSKTEDGVTSVPTASQASSTSDFLSYDLKDLDVIKSTSRSSFRSIHFEHSGSGEVVSSDESSGNDSDPIATLFASNTNGIVENRVRAPPPLPRTLYIQMEFVERQTLRELIREGEISEDEAWRLFQQIVDALVHMSEYGILHRDIKPNNIFIDGKGNCKIGDFGLATSSLAAVDPSDVSPQITMPNPDMTLQVGTALYIAPEIQQVHNKRGLRNHSKADMYSLGIVFFEMNYRFGTDSERFAVLENLRKSAIIFPSGWEPHRSRQLIHWLLQHNPDDRPTAGELSQSPLLPQRLADGYFKSALKMMTKPDSPHHQAVLSSLFSQPPRTARGFTYDAEAELPEHTALNDIVQQDLSKIFRLHGAVDMEPPLLMPVMNPEDQANQATFLDRHGDLVALPSNALVPFARLAARMNSKRIKRYHITDIFRPNTVAGHPKFTKVAVFDMITPDLENGPVAAAAEMIAIAHDCLDNFPNLSQFYEIHISHSKIVDLALSRIPEDLRSAVVDIVTQSKSSASQKRALLLKKGLLRSSADELEILSEIDDDFDTILARLEKATPVLLSLISDAINEVRNTVQFANSAGVTRPIFFHPLMLGKHHTHFKDGVRFELVKRSKRTDVLVAGGRYDNLISQHSLLKNPSERVCAFGGQIALDKITMALAAYQSTSVKALVKEQRSFGFWSPRRCDVYVVSYQAGYLQERLEVAALLWQHGISADVMYESGLRDAEHENHVDACAREGILFTVYPRPRTARPAPAFKVKSVLKGTEYEITRQELVGWLHQQIAEQKRIDASTSGAPAFTENLSTSATAKEMPASDEVQLILPADTKKQRRQTKQIFSDRAFDITTQLKSEVLSGMPTVGVDVTPTVFDMLTRSAAWLTDEDTWRSVVAAFPSQHTAYAPLIREAVAKRKAEGHKFVLLVGVREERVGLLALA
ncbi:hypothetical protein PLICRDRAFT_114396 [Plicaturopsis crispa FD-325 SS-3]|nr:hypothetical protein PLICRDRAFT_114396 [Plicaturopsis crispa FD-325 SS-3]